MQNYRVDPETEAILFTPPPETKEFKAIQELSTKIDDQTKLIYNILSLVEGQQKTIKKLKEMFEEA